MARIYHRDQPGAPTVPFNASASSSDHFNALKIILKACLVDGYGALPAAGWSLAYESTNTLILRTGSNSGYFCIRNTSGSGAQADVWLAQTFEGVDGNGIIIGAGRRSGLAINSSVPQKLVLTAAFSFSAATTWAILADAATAIVVLSASVAGSATEIINTSAGNQAYANYHFYIGDDSFGDLVCFGGTNTTGTPFPNFSSLGCTILKFPDTGLLVDSASAVVDTFSLWGPTFHNSLNGALFPTLELQHVTWHCNGVIRKLRGVAQDFRLVGAWASHASQAIGGPSLTTRTVSTPIDIGDGHSYLIGLAHSTRAMTNILTTNPVFW
jgi:hypothetical protein